MPTVRTQQSCNIAKATHCNQFFSRVYSTLPSHVVRPSSGMHRHFKFVCTDSACVLIRDGLTKRIYTTHDNRPRVRFNSPYRTTFKINMRQPNGSFDRTFESISSIMIVKTILLKQTLSQLELIVALV